MWAPTSPPCTSRDVTGRPPCACWSTCPRQACSPALRCMPWRRAPARMVAATRRGWRFWTCSCLPDLRSPTPYSTRPPPSPARRPGSGSGPWRCCRSARMLERCRQAACTPRASETVARCPCGRWRIGCSSTPRSGASSSTWKPTCPCRSPPSSTTSLRFRSTSSVGRWNVRLPRPRPPPTSTSTTTPTTTLPPTPTPMSLDDVGAVGPEYGAAREVQLLLPKTWY
mmetsp:Transcript_81232/g.233470  ORF Transcript_81232/g.233470 Transcript_81232/m.233470 type:complete len:226 (-) Transcript_81232:84-761(-)